VVEHGDAVRELVCLLEVLRGEEDRDAIGHQVTHDRPHRAAAARVQPGGGLVEKDDARVADVLAAVPKGSAEMVAAAIRTVFAQPDAEHVAEQFDVIATMLGRSHPKVEAMMHGARQDLPAFTRFPASHWKKIWSTTPWNG